MWVLLLELAVAFFVLAFIVWWTMFSDKKADADEQKPNDG